MAKDYKEKEVLVLEYIKTKKEGLKEDVVIAYTPLVEYIARRLAFYREDIPDLVQVGSIGLLKSLDNFEPKRKVAFSTFASSNIIGEIRHYLRDKTRIVKIPRKIHDNYSKISQFIKSFTQERGQYPTIQDIAKHTELDVDFVLECMEAIESTKVVSLDKPMYQSTQSQFGEQATLIDSLGFTPQVDKPLDNAILNNAVEALSERKKMVIRCRFFEGMTQREISEKVNCSQMHVSRLIQDALGELKGALKDSFKNE